MKKHIHLNSVPEAGTLFKKEASSTNRMSRVNFLFVLLLFITTFSAYAQNCNVGLRGNAYDDPADGIYVSPEGNDAIVVRLI